MDSGATAFISLPREGLPLSASVDFLHFAVLDKPAVRFKPEQSALRDLIPWCGAHNWFSVVDEDAFCCIARNQAVANRVLEVDRQVEPHTLELGTLLGYPPCCCEAMAHAGESAIDERAATACGWLFEDRFRLIDPSQYGEGRSLICHVPCSPTCEASLELAERAIRFLRHHVEHPAFEQWAGWKHFM